MSIINWAAKGLIIQKCRGQIFQNPEIVVSIHACTVYPQYVGIKKPLDGFSHYINIGVRMRERFWLKRYLADVRSP